VQTTTTRSDPAVPRPRGTLQLPDVHVPVPQPVRLFVICAWAAGLGLLGLPVAARLSIAIVTGTAPGWFEPVVIGVGVLGIAVTAATFAAMHRRWLPWLLLLAGTLLLAGNAALALSLPPT
jgi:hypothetical protein